MVDIYLVRLDDHAPAAACTYAHGFNVNVSSDDVDLRVPFGTQRRLLQGGAERDAGGDLIDLSHLGRHSRAMVHATDTFFKIMENSDLGRPHAR